MENAKEYWKNQWNYDEFFFRSSSSSSRFHFFHSFLLFLVSLRCATDCDVHCVELNYFCDFSPTIGSRKFNAWCVLAYVSNSVWLFSFSVFCLHLLFSLAHNKLITEGYKIEETEIILLAYVCCVRCSYKPEKKICWNGRINGCVCLECK